MDWCKMKKVKRYTENVILTYLSELSQKYKSSTLWSINSMLKATLSVKHNVDIGSYSKVTAYLKKQSVGHVTKKSRTFSQQEINSFLGEAPDEIYLMAKRNGVNSGDRFIPRRVGTNFEALNYMLLKEKSSGSPRSDPAKENKRYTNQAYLRWQKQMFQERIWSVAQVPTRILRFSEHQKKGDAFVHCQMWPVRARKKPLIGAPSTVLDMPYLEGNICHHVTDWGSKGYLASVFEGEVYLWHPETNNPYVVTNTGGKVEKCIRWNKSATHFAVALDGKGIAVYDFKKNYISNETVCTCSPICSVTSLQWTKTNLLVSGCTAGRLSVWSPQLKLLKIRYPVHSGTIISITLSATERYLATSGTDGNVRVWFWPGLKEHFEVSYCTPVRGVAWHPWKDPLIAIGGGFGDGSLSIWNACNHKQVGYKPAADNGAVCVDSLTWSPLTGELVVSYWQQQERTRSSWSEGNNSILVLSSLTTEVDAIEWHIGRVLYLLWGENGTKLATAATDENLCMWDFFGAASKTPTDHKQSNPGKRAEISCMETSKSFGYCIR